MSGLCFQKWPKAASFSIIINMILACLSSFFLLQNPSYSITFSPWIFDAKWGIFLNVTQAYLLAMVMSISLIVHIYSLGYMKNDPRKIKFLAHLSFFTLSMIIFLVSPNFLQLFVGWEFIGISSYLLIGFWHHSLKAQKAAFKAFIVNRIGDVGIILAIAVLFLDTNSFSLVQSFKNVTHPEIIVMFLFLGVMAKSAQFGMHIWLPDAMEGPTPVSALIHSATMVTAGVILMIRLSSLFLSAPFMQNVIFYIGSFTTLYAGLTACYQNDIKRIIAYSTCSQLGLMVMSCGIGAYSLALFHLITHAFFKALLFLSAGSVIHAMSNEQNIHHMGNLYHRIPYTYASMWVGFLNLMGIPFFSGYFSKEAIVHQLGSKSWIAMVGSCFTACYCARLLYFVFHAPCHASERVMAYMHEASSSMRIPTLLLSFVSIGLGAIISQHFVPFSLSAYNFFPWICPFIVFLGAIFLYQKGYFTFSHTHIKSKTHFITHPFSFVSCRIIPKVDNALNYMGYNGWIRFLTNNARLYKEIQTGYISDYVIWVGCTLIMGMIYLLFCSL